MKPSPSVRILNRERNRLYRRWVTVTTNSMKPGGEVWKSIELAYYAAIQQLDHEINNHKQTA